ALDDAVFERMEADDGQPPAFAQQTLGCEQPLDQLFELTVHRNAQRLEGARCGMGIAWLAAYGLLDDLCQLQRRFDRRFGARRNDELGNATGLALFAKG